MTWLNWSGHVVQGKNAPPYEKNNSLVDLRDSKMGLQKGQLPTVILELHGNPKTCTKTWDDGNNTWKKIILASQPLKNALESFGTTAQHIPICLSINKRFRADLPISLTIQKTKYNPKMHMNHAKVHEEATPPVFFERMVSPSTFHRCGTKKRPCANTASALLRGRPDE